MIGDYFMLRVGLAALATIMVLAGYLIGGPVLVVTGILIILSIVGERIIDAPVENGVPGRGWHATDEKFIDPVTGKPVQVYFNPTTGQRRYITIISHHD